MKTALNFSFLFISISVLLIACTKDSTPEPAEVVPPEIVTLFDSLSGTYAGYRYLEQEDIHCPGGEPPCFFIYAYDTVYVTLQVVNIGDSLLQITDMYDGYCNRTISLDPSLFYDGPPINFAPHGHYKLQFSEVEPFENLILDIVEGGGDNYDARYYFYDYELAKE
jgi:hypothetical protein